MRSINITTLFCTLAFTFVSLNSVAEERIISAGHSVTELIYALNAEPSLVAIDITSKNEKTATLPAIGYHRQLSAEGLLAMDPTRVIGSDEMGPKSTLDILEKSGVTLNIINTEPTIEGLLARVDQIAALTQHQSEAIQVKSDINKQITQLNQNIPAKEKQKKVIYLLIHEGRAPYIAGNNTTIDEMIHLAGAINPAKSTIESFKPISMEAMITMQPDVILVSQRSIKKMKGIEELIQSIPTIKSTPAGINKQIFGIEGSALIGGLGLSSLNEAARLNGLLYPAK